jgi:hypothetical protein
MRSDETMTRYAFNLADDVTAIRFADRKANRLPFGALHW